MLPTLEIDVLHLEPGLLAITQEEHLLGVVDHEDPLVSENVRLRKVAWPIGVDHPVRSREEFPVVRALQVEGVLMCAQVVLEKQILRKV